MLRIDLSGMSRAELRRLLATAEARGQDGLAGTFRAELAARATGEDARPKPPPPPGAFDDDDEPGPIVVHADPPPLPPLEPIGRRARPDRRWPVGLAAAVALVVGGATAWGLNGAPGWPRGEGGAATPAPRAMTIRSAPAPAPAAVAVQSPRPQAPAEPPPPPTPEPTTLATAAPAPASEPGPRRVDPCARPPSPADRLLCNDLALNLLQHEARDAYGRALAAGADPVAVRESEAAWRRARDPTSDPRALAGLYERRIRELKAMTAEAVAGSARSEPPQSDDRQQN